MKFVLLTHAREVDKPSNTGQLVQKNIPDTLTIVWQRTQPDKLLLDIINTCKVALVYPSDEHDVSTHAVEYDYCILIDGTWQEARKIINRSAYLKDLPRISITVDKKSAYRLRRNQLEDGLCTAESAIELLRHSTRNDEADLLQQCFTAFLQKHRA